MVATMRNSEGRVSRLSAPGAGWLFVALLTGCGYAWQNFSQHPGFAAYYAAHPRATEAASLEQRALLQRYRPRLWVAAGTEGPLSFYGDYIAQGELRDASGRLLSAPVGRLTLNRLRDRPDVVFNHQPRAVPVTPVAFARIDSGRHPALGELQFLTYHFVFRHSGLVAGLPHWQRWPLSLVGDLDDWHQLDHYTAATLVLDGGQQPMALLLQQHNHQRSYLFGIDLPLPDDHRPALVAARRSNELYPLHAGVRRHRVVRFLSPASLPYLVTGAAKPWLSGDDISEAGREVDYQLDFLAADDAFYSFAGYLGERRRLAGRDGPPGADFNTLPALKEPVATLVAFNWREGDTEQMAALMEYLRDPGLEGAAFARLLARFQSKRAQLGGE